MITAIIYLAVSVLHVKQIDVNPGACFGEIDYWTLTRTAGSVA